MGLRRRHALALIGAGVLALACPAPSDEGADLVLLGGRIVTLDPDRPEVAALAARDGRILALGDDASIRRHVTASTVSIDLQGRLAVPGFIEGHGHFTGLGRALMTVDLREARTWEEVVEKTVAAARTAEPGDWITGYGWHQEKWDRRPEPQVEGYPTHDLLSRAISDNPVLLKHAAGSHGAVVNALALERSGIDATTPDPPGGKILRDASGRPTGVLRETAVDLALDAQQAWLESATPEQRAARVRREIELADRESLSKGITSFQDAGSDYATVDALREVAESGELGVRLWVMLRVDQAELERRARDYWTVGGADDHLTVRAIKLAIDGALGSHGAWLVEPYADLPSSSGLNTTPLDEIEQAARFAIENGWQIGVHAIGDRANRETLDLFEETFRLHPDREDLRWRIEHAQHLTVEDIPRLRLAQADRLGSRRQQRHRRSGRGRRPDRQFPCVGHATHGRRRGVPRRATHDAPRGAALLHHRRGLRSSRGHDQGLARAGQARRRDRALARHPRDSGRADPGHRGAVHDRRRPGAVRRRQLLTRPHLQSLYTHAADRPQLLRRG
jgi:predicted amidohydrolase YtcJ